MGAFVGRAQELEALSRIDRAAAAGRAAAAVVVRRPRGRLAARGARACSTRCCSWRSPPSDPKEVELFSGFRPRIVEALCEREEEV
jgi:hypothetical protein